MHMDEMHPLAFYRGFRIAAARYKPAGMAALHTLTVLIVLAICGAPAGAADCAGLAGLALKDTTITSATVVPAAGAVPEYCKVLGHIHNLPQSTIQFEVSLPTTKWNGKYFVAGGGGYNGVIPRLTQALTEGYAAAGSDTGHEAKDANWAFNNLDAQNNYAYLATHVVTLIGKQILRAFYAQHERRSYFVGCSNGGKMALAEIQRYPDDFDAAIAGDPVIDRTRLMMQYVWNAQALAARPDSASQDSSDRKGHDERVPGERRRHQRSADDSRPVQVRSEDDSLRVRRRPQLPDGGPGASSAKDAERAGERLGN